MVSPWRPRAGSVCRWCEIRHNLEEDLVHGLHALLATSFMNPTEGAVLMTITESDLEHAEKMRRASDASMIRDLMKLVILRAYCEAKPGGIDAQE
jgi:hypothetical protein